MPEANVNANFYRSSLNGVEKDFVSITIKGQKDNWVGPVRPIDLTRFPDEWSIYKEGNKSKKVGTPLTNLPGMNEPKLTELASRDIEMIEELVDMSDGAIMSMGPIWFELKKIALLYIDANGRADKVVALEKPAARRGRPPKKVEENDIVVNLSERV